MKTLLCATALAVAAAPAFAAESVTYETEQSFDDVVFGLEAAILGQGLVIDHVSHVGDMLERTREATGSDVVLFEGADIYSFCSATVSRQVMEADPMNIVHCPYHIFVMTQPDTPGVTTIGYRDFADASMDPVEELLDTIAREAIGRE